MDQFGGGVDLRRECLLVNLFVKMKELGPVGGEHGPENFVCRSAFESLSAEFQALKILLTQ